MLWRCWRLPQSPCRSETGCSPLSRGPLHTVLPRR
jgi:hypothetical protein